MPDLSDLAHADHEIRRAVESGDIETAAKWLEVRDRIAFEMTVEGKSTWLPWDDTPDSTD